MARLVATLMSEGAALDLFSNRFTAFNLLESVACPKLPALLARLAILTIYELDEQQETIFERVALLSPKGEPVGQASTVQIGFSALGEGGMPNSHRSLHMLWGLKFDVAGVYSLRVEHAPDLNGPWRMVGSRMLAVVIGVPALAQIPTEKPVPRHTAKPPK